MHADLASRNSQVLRAVHLEAGAVGDCPHLLCDRLQADQPVQPREYAVQSLRVAQVHPLRRGAYQRRRDRGGRRALRKPLGGGSHHPLAMMSAGLTAAGGLCTASCGRCTGRAEQ